MATHRLGTRIRDARLIRGMTGRETAEKLGLSPSGYRYIEDGERAPSYDTLCRIVELLQIDPRELLPGFAPLA